ncbi:MAG: hypothetical protein ACE10G_10655, partial [Gemmatimonadales bacterium]
MRDRTRPSRFRGVSESGEFDIGPGWGQARGICLPSWIRFGGTDAGYSLRAGPSRIGFRRLLVTGKP